MKEYGGKVRVVYMNMVVHPDAVLLAHQYGCAAAKQKKFIEYKHAFWDKSFGAYAASGGKDRAALGEDAILKYAPEIGVDANKLKADANSPECKQRLAEDMQELSKFRVNGTPAFFINGMHIGGGIPKEAFKQIIDEKLKIAEASKVPGAEYYAKEIMGKGVPQFRSKRDAKAAPPPPAPAPAPGPAEAPPAGGSAAPAAGSAAKPAPAAGSAAKPAPAAGSAAKPAPAAGSAAKP